MFWNQNKDGDRTVFGVPFGHTTLDTRTCACLPVTRSFLVFLPSFLALQPSILDIAANGAGVIIVGGTVIDEAFLSTKQWKVLLSPTAFKDSSTNVNAVADNDWFTPHLGEEGNRAGQA